MKFFPYFFIIIIGLAVWGCSGADVINGLVPNSGYTLKKDISYGNDKRQMLDIYIPQQKNDSAAVIVFFYGGSWQSGNKDDYRFAAQALSSKGYITVIADYRLYPQVHFPAFMDDAANAFKWVHSHIKEYGGNPQKLYLCGHSAGAYIAVMLTVNDSYLRAAGADRKWIKGTIGIAGPYDFLPFTDPKIKEIFSSEKDVFSQPINYVTSGLPPMLLVTGDEDTDVYPKNTRNMAAKLRQYNDMVKEIIYPDVAHIGIILSLADGFRGKAPLLADIDKFIKEY